MKLNSFWQGIIIGFVFTFIFTYSLFFNITKPIELAHSDTFHVTLTLKHYMDVVFNNNWGSLLTMPMFYGFKDSLLYSELFIMEAIMALPIYIVVRDIIITYNVLAIFTIFLSFLSMYFCVRYATKKTVPSILASVIYVFNPFVVGHFPDNLHYFSLMWIPPIFLFLDKYLIKHNNKDGFLLFVFLVFQLLTTLTFGALLTVILPVYSLIRIIQLKLITKISDIKKYLCIGAIIGFVLFGLTAFSVNKTYEIYFKDISLGRNLAETAFFSPWVSDLFLTAPNNVLYGGGREWLKEALPLFYFNNAEYIERNLFFGFSVILLLVLSITFLRKSSYKKIWVASIICLLLCIVLSFGPRIRFTQDFSLPGLYGFIHQFHPLLQSLRVASRFMVIAFYFLGVISALTLIELLKRLNHKTGIIMASIIIFFVVLEYSSVPWKFYTIPQDVRSMYSILDSKKNIGVILELPMGNLFTRIGLANNQFAETEYMLYASKLHNKKLLNGYSSYTPVAYPPRIEFLTINFPNPQKLEQLRKWGVGAIGIHKDSFYDSVEYFRIKKQLENLKMKKLFESDSVALFDITKSN